jgi:guanyl-specific ribonuclease Sa
LNILEPIGQKIKVLLPFSNKDYYEEYLVNIDYISDELSKLNIVQETNNSFRDYLTEYSKLNKAGYIAMDESDKIYSGLYHYYGFYKQKPVEKSGSSNKGRRRKILT